MFEGGLVLMGVIEDKGDGTSDFRFGESCMKG